MLFRISLFTVLFSVMSLGVSAQEIQSDYQIQQEFKDQYEEYEQQLRQASSPAQVDSMVTSIKQFDQKYSEHAELLNKALYPDTYQQKMEELKKSALKGRKQLATIKDLNANLQNLQGKLASYEKNITDLNRRTDSLKTVLNKSSANERQLSRTLQQYKNNLEKRDKLLLSFIDSMTAAQKRLNAAVADSIMESPAKKKRINTGENALEMMANVSDQHLDILQTQAANLEVNDYMRMAEVQYKFEQMWSQLGDQITDVYEGENADQLANKVDENIQRWDEVLQAQMFSSLNSYFQQKDIAVSDFETPTGFYKSLSGYLNNHIAQTKKDPSEELYQQYKAFEQFWDKLKLEWSDTIVASGILTNAEMQTINGKVTQWAELNQDRANNNLLVYLLGGSVLLAVALGVMLVREKKTKQ
ncbi:hypothetical protein LX73_0532 [Fodinibius salinus]|uniref:Uncharacterized protein n=1 Tax=Fodinibius salinus TaxID=860790 RepID=A0A5D3YM55_9BACT|nr:hypothetical protein [Fodinibius salinus]TYP95235.1 hypothetical protein LX73_0532 [Fodinibius salinus]